jgi:hypothetical protein
MDPQWRVATSYKLLGNEFRILAFEMNVGPKLGLVKYSVPPVTADPGERRDTSNSGGRAVVCRWSSSEREDDGEDILRESVDWSLVVEQRADLFQDL